MIKKELQNLLDQIKASASKEELLWINGYISALIGGESEVSVDTSKIVEKLTIIYVTETGNSKFISEQLAKALKEKGVKVKIKASNQYRFADLEKEKNVIFIASTHGEGEMPASGTKLFDYLKSGPNLSKLNFLTIALGDTNYTQFCQSGKDIETEILKNKAKKLAQRIDLDLDFEERLNEIKEITLNAFSGNAEAANSVKKSTKANKSQYVGTVLSNINLNDEGSKKETYHVEIGFEDEVNYEPGDSAGIILEDDKGNKISPRLYSIASHAGEHESELHLTVALAKHVDENGVAGTGLFSGYLSKLKEGDEVKFYISKNRLFKLPENSKDVIMVGPGTGVAPFRSYLSARNYDDASGKNWLFFGNPNFATDFLYQTEFLDYLNSGFLTNLDVAFSRDQKEKIYVQHRIAQKGKELFEWLENGSFFYVCGDKEFMAPDVEAAVIEAVKTHGGKNAEDAKNYVENLKNEGRYLTDIY